MPPVVHDVADDVGADPPHRVRREAHAAVRVEVLDRLEQPDVALLHEVEQVVDGALVLARDHHDEAEIRGDEVPRRLPVALLLPLDGELVLLLARQDGDAADLGEVAREVSIGTSEPPICAVAGSRSRAPASRRTPSAPSVDCAVASSVVAVVLGRVAVLGSRRRRSQRRARRVDPWP